MARNIVGGQQGPHRNLKSIVRRHLETEWRRPIAAHTEKAFDEAVAWLGDTRAPVVLDSGCGTGESTRVLAARLGGSRVIGIDKSAARLSRHSPPPGAEYLLVRADANDFWRLAAGAGWRLDRHYLLYPNPWPKAGQITKRWHGSPAFPALLALGGALELRTNWAVYAEEFVMALEIAGISATWGEIAGGESLSPFERKYAGSGQVLYVVTADLDSRA